MLFRSAAPREIAASVASQSTTDPANVSSSNGQDLAGEAKILVEVVSHGREPTDCHMRPTMPFEKLMRAWCQHQEVSLADVCFKLSSNDRCLVAEDTPNSCGWAPEHGTLAIHAELIAAGAASSSKQATGEGMTDAAKPGAEGTVAAEPQNEKISVVVEAHGAEGTMNLIS